MTKGMSKLLQAVLRRNAEEAAAALAQGAIVDERDTDGRTPLMHAAIEGDVSCAQVLLSHGADVSATDGSSYTALHFAAQEGHLQVAQALLDAGAHVDACDRHGNTPLGKAVFHSRGRGDVITLLVRHGADKDLKNRSGISPRELARTIANYDISKWLDDVP